MGTLGAPVNSMDLLISIAKAVFLAVMLIQVVPIMVWVERRGSALIQNRLGPNRVGPLGLFQSLADAVKFLSKEHYLGKYLNSTFFYVAAPLVMLMPAFMTFAVVPIAAPIRLSDGSVFTFQVADLNVGLLYIFAIASLGVYGVVMAGWASNNKYSLLGSLRSSSQMISYELSMGLSVVGIIMAFSSVKLGDIAAAQGATWQLLGFTLPKWGILIQPLGFVIFLTSVFAETNRLPFDLPEGESEIVAGYHLEYGPGGFALFMMGEYINMTTASALLATLYFGGWQAPGMDWVLAHSGLAGQALEWLRVAIQATAFLVKVLFFLWFFVWVRWTLPRFRYDQLMDLGWKVMLPLSLLNIFVTGLLIFYGVF